MTMRTRFAPSPTGFLHLGSARTALYCWLFARKTQGTFILRIEDTDRERSTQEAIDAILDGLEWMGLKWDEGPFYQMQRLERYHTVANKLIQEDKAYRCYCSKDRLEKLRETQLAAKQKPRYDGFCRNHPPADTHAPFVVRFKNPESGVVIVNDVIHGQVEIQNSELDDLIIVRSDGVPTYNFSVVVDDWDMKVTHIIRGDDHLANTPRQINMLNALGHTPPIYAHISMILGPDGKRLSKRHGAVSVQYYRDEGILPQALMNYLVRLGWSHGDQEIFSIQEMIEYFDIKDLHTSAAAFNPEKLLWLNQHYIKEADPESLAPLLEKQLLNLGVTATQLHSGPILTAVIIAQKERARTLKEMAEKSLFFYQSPEVLSPELKEKHFTAEVLPVLQQLTTEFKNLSSWNAESIHQIIQAISEKSGLKLGKLAQPLRVAMTGGTVSPSIDVTLALIGQAETLKRLNRALI